MKKLQSIFPLTLIFLLAFVTLTCTDTPEKNMASPPADDTVATTFNEALANELGADDYGMRQYVMAF